MGNTQYSDNNEVSFKIGFAGVGAGSNCGRDIINEIFNWVNSCDEDGKETCKSIFNNMLSCKPDPSIMEIPNEVLIHEYAVVTTMRPLDNGTPCVLIKQKGNNYPQYPRYNVISIVKLSELMPFTKGYKTSEGRPIFTVHAQKAESHLFSALTRGHADNE